MGIEASVNFPGDLVARPEKTPTSSKRSGQAPSRARGLSHVSGCTFHSGGSQIRGGDMIERPRHPGEPTVVFAIPVSTYRAEKTPQVAEKSDERPR